MAELKGLLFDVDGTLVDNLAYHFAAFDEYAKREGFTLLEPMSLKMNGMHSNQIFPMMVGDKVVAGQEVAILEAMKMENSITSDYSGVVKQILVAEGDNLQSDTPMIEIVAETDAPKVTPKAEPEVAAPVAAGPKSVVAAPLPGRVISLKVKVGDKVAAGQEVVVLEAMKMENSISSDYAGTVVEILVAEGDNVQSDAPMVVIQ